MTDQKLVFLQSSLWGSAITKTGEPARFLQLRPADKKLPRTLRFREQIIYSLSIKPERLTSAASALISLVRIYNAFPQNTSSHCYRPVSG